MSQVYQSMSLSPAHSLPVASKLLGTLHKYKHCQAHTWVCYQWSGLCSTQTSPTSATLFCWLGRPTLSNPNGCIQAEYYHVQSVSRGNSCRVLDNATHRCTGDSSGGKSGSLGKILRNRHGLRSFGASRKGKPSFQ